jgi:Fe-S-cluster containining protein
MSTNPATPYLLDFGDAEPLRLDLRLPAGEVTVRALLPAIFEVADAIHRRSARQLAAMGKTIGCGEGCGECCHQLVPVSEHEAVHLADAVRALPDAERGTVVAGFTRATLALDQAGLLTPLNTAFAAGATDRAATTALARRYWALRIPCPFLVHGSCLIHAHRPVACRQYLVTSPPSRCAALYGADQDHEVVVHPVDAGGALAAFSGLGMEHSRVLPLVFSLLAERSLRAMRLPTLPAAQMMGRYLTLLSLGFSRPAS